MDKISASIHSPLMRSTTRTAADSALLSKQVSATEYFFLNLSPSRGSSSTVSAGGRERCNPDYVVRRRKYGYTVLELVIAGSGHVVLDGTKFPLSAGSVFTYRRDTACEIHTDPVDRLVKYFICLSGHGANSQLNRAGLKPARAWQLPQFNEVQALLAQMVREGQARTKYSPPICDTLFELVLLKIQEALAVGADQPPAGQEKFLRVKKIIDTQAAELPSLAALSQRAGIPPVALCKLFAQHLGLSPFRYLMRRKMEIAAEHLAQHGGLIKEAAAHVGFADPYHFSRRFKRAHGVTPTRLRKQQNPASRVA
jgi:AraC family transcriptional regulator